MRPDQYAMYAAKGLERCQTSRVRLKAASAKLLLIQQLCRHRRTRRCAGRAQVLRRGKRGRSRVSAARPWKAVRRGPRSNAGAREPRRGRNPEQWFSPILPKQNGAAVEAEPDSDRAHASRSVRDIAAKSCRLSDDKRPAQGRFAPLRRVTFLSGKVTKAIAPGLAPSGFPHSGDAPPGRAEGPSLVHRRWLGIPASLPDSAPPPFGLRPSREWWRL